MALLLWLILGLIVLVIAGPGLSLLGFTAGGIKAGSIGAWLMSVMHPTTAGGLVASFTGLQEEREGLLPTVCACVNFLDFFPFFYPYTLTFFFFFFFFC